MTDNLKRFLDMPSCCCYGLIDGKILRWCGTQRVRFLLWQKQLRAIVRRTMSSLCRRKRLGELCPQAAKLWIFLLQIPAFLYLTPGIMSLKPWIFEANASEVLKLARLVFLQSMQLEVSSVPLEGRFAQQRDENSQNTVPLQVKGQRAMAAELQCKVRFSRKKIWKWWIIDDIWWYQICFFASYVFSFVYMVVWCDTNSPNS